MFGGQSTSENFSAFCWQGATEVIKVKTVFLGLIEMEQCGKGSWGLVLPCVYPAMAYVFLLEMNISLGLCLWK